MHLFAPGHRGCAGCGPAISMRMIVDTLGEDIVVVNSTGCMEIISTPYPQSAWRVPYIHSLFENAPAVASGIAKYFEVKGKNTKVVCICGDGAAYDIGFGSLSGMLDRNDNVLFICYDNEGYMNCLAKDSLVMTGKGLRPITEIKEGDLLYSLDPDTHKLVLRKCAGVYDNGVKETFEISTLHHSLKATGNHPFLTVEHRGKEPKLVWKTAEELRAGDGVVVSKSSGEGKRFRFPAIEAVSKGDYKVNKLNEMKIPESSSPELMEYLGIYLGDGWVREGRGEIGFSMPEGTEERERLFQVHGSVFGNSIKADADEVHVHSVNLANFIRSLGFGSGAKNKVVPDWVFTLPREEKEAFVKGLLLSDGYELGKSKRYVSASFELLRRLRLLLQTIGYRVGKIHRQKKAKGTLVVKRRLLKDSEYGYICFSKPGEWNTEKYRSQYKHKNFLIDNEYFAVEEIREVKSLGREGTLDLQVEGSHNFIANGYVVHNTGVQKSGATPFGASTTTSQVGRKVRGKREWKKSLVEIAAAHRIQYAATASIGFWKDFENKLKKAADMKGARVIVVLVPCPPGWGSASDITVQLSKLAVECGMWKLYEIENGRTTVNYKPKMAPVSEYFALQKRFKHLSEPEMEEIGARVRQEWARADELTSCATKVGELEKGIADAKKEREELVKSIENYKKQVGEEESRIKGLNDNIEKMKLELEAVRKAGSSDMVDKVSTAAEEIIKDMEAKLEEAQREKEEASAALEAGRKQLGEDEARIGELNAEVESGKAELEEARKACELAIAAKATELEGRIAALDAEKAELQSKADVYAKQIEGDEQRIRELEESGAKLGAEMEEEKKQYEMVVEGKEAELAEARGEEKALLEAKEAELAKVKGEAAQIAAKDEELGKKLESEEAELRKAKEKLEAAEKEIAEGGFAPAAGVARGYPLRAPRERELWALREERADLEERLEDYRHELKRDRRRIETLEDDIKEIMSELVLARRLASAGLGAGLGLGRFEKKERRERKDEEDEDVT